MGTPSRSALPNPYGERRRIVRDERARLARSDACRRFGQGQDTGARDSFAQGCQVSDPELFSSVWQATRPDLEIVNAGVGGYGTVQELLLFRRIAPIIEPDAVVLMVYVNDLTDNVMPFYPGLGPRPYFSSDGEIAPVDWQSFRPLLPPVPGRGWLYFYSWGVQRWQAQRMLRPKAARAAAVYTQQWKSRVSGAEQWRILEQLLSRFPTGKLTIVAIPRRKEVRLGDVTFTSSLAALANHLGVGVVDLQPVLRPDHYFQGNIHWNVRGHEVVARRLASTINVADSDGEAVR